MDRWPERYLFFIMSHHIFVAGERAGSLLSRCPVQTVIPEAFLPSFAASLRTSAVQFGSASYQDVQPDYETITKAENDTTSG